MSANSIYMYIELYAYVAHLLPQPFSARGPDMFVLFFACDVPTYYPSYLIESYSKGAWHCFCLVFGCKDPTYYQLFTARRFDLFVLSLGVTFPLITPVT